MEYRLVFYQDERGRSQPLDYLKSLKPKHEAKAKKWMQLLMEEGPNLPRPYADMLEHGIRELRVPIEHHQHRFLYAIRDKVIVVTNAFLKKSQEVPQAEIDRARKAYADWVNRRGWEQA